MNKETLNKLKETMESYKINPHDPQAIGKWHGAIIQAGPALIALAERSTAPVSQMTDAEIHRIAQETFADGTSSNDDIIFARAILAAVSQPQAAKPVALNDFKDGIHRLTMRHIDRMNDVCDEDTAQQIIKSFTEGFDILYDTYMTLRVQEIEADRAAKPNADCSGDPTSCPDNEGYGCACDPMNKAGKEK